METPIGQRLKALRKEHGMTLEEVGKAVGVGKSTVRKWETGMIENMRQDKLSRLAKVFDVSPAYLMGWEEEPKQLDTAKAALLAEVENMSEEQAALLLAAFQAAKAAK